MDYGGGFCDFKDIVLRDMQRKIDRLTARAKGGTLSGVSFDLEEKRLKITIEMPDGTQEELVVGIQRAHESCDITLSLNGEELDSPF